MIKALRTFTLTLICAYVLSALNAQHTVGLISYDFDKTYDGYNLIYPHSQPNVYLLNNCGEIVNVWEDEPLIRPGNSVYLLENGDLVKCSRHNTVTDDVIWAGGGGEFIEIRDWDNNLKWHFTLNDSLQRIHHDVAVMPNGNILAITWERKLKDEAIAAGRDTAMLTKGEIWPEAILEIKPEGDTFQIVWEWHVWDHLIQDYDSTKANYGVLADNPGLIDLNWGSNEGTSSWMHGNAIDYHPVLDQVLLSIPNFDELWIIDHSTTTEEASSHKGGLSGRGGDLMFRWGNPAVYDRGSTDNHKLFFQHNGHWVDAHLDASHPHFGKIATYNNRVGADSSSAVIFNPLFLDYAWMYGMGPNGTFLPDGYDWSYSHPDKTKMFSGGLSSVQLLKNGNTLYCVGNTGYAFEVTSTGEVVWEYKVPFKQGNAVSQGDQLLSSENVTWRMHRYPADYPAFAGRDLSGLGFIELNPDTAFCDLTSAVGDVNTLTDVSVFPNPASETLTVYWDDNDEQTLQLLDNLGRVILTKHVTGGQVILDTGKIAAGSYWLRLGKHTPRKVIISR